MDRDFLPDEGVLTDSIDFEIIATMEKLFGLDFKDTRLSLYDSGLDYFDIPVLEVGLEYELDITIDDLNVEMSIEKVIEMVKEAVNDRKN